MEQIRLILLIALSFISLMLWEAWQRDYGPEPAADTPAAVSKEQSLPTDLPTPVAQVSPDADAPVSAQAVSTTRIHVRTDVLALEIGLQGASIQKAELLRYPDEDIAERSPFNLLDDSATRYFVHQSGLKAVGTESPDHYATYASSAESYALQADADEIRVPFIWRGANGLTVRKEYLLRRGSYEIGIRYFIENNGDQPLSFNHYEQLQRRHADSRSYLIHTFTGAAVSTPQKRYQKYTYDDLQDEPVSLSAKDGWASILEHYFVTAIIPVPETSYHYYSSIIGDSNYAIGFYGPANKLEPGAQMAIDSRVYVGPKLQKVLERVAPGLDLTVDYGILWFIGKLLFWTLTQLHALFGNWGWAIILLTCIVKGLFFPLSAAGYRSMAKMRKVQPRLLAIRDRYQNDRNALNQAMMDLYKKEKINPLGGCLPILVQIPVFISLYWVILESVELRQAPWVFWITDLSIKDPFFVLPVLMTISMWMQARLNPAPLDPMQARVMQIMPFAFGFFFAFFPSGLVLYWFINNVLSIGQQWYITRNEERA